MDAREVADRVEIRRLVDLYAIACDSLDWALLRTVFTPDAVLDYSEFGGARTDVDAGIAWLSAGLPRYSTVHHNNTTHHCEIDGDTARAVTYVLSYLVIPDGDGGEEIMTSGGFYRDRLVRQADGWRISERIDLGAWIMTPLPKRMTTPPPWFGTMDHHRPTLLAN